MTAATKDLTTPRRHPIENLILGVAASTTIYGGTLVAVNASGFAVPASADRTLRVMGVAEFGAVGTTNGAVKIAVRREVALFGNSASTDAITVADIDRHVFVVDDNTVARTPGTGNVRPLAGRVIDVTTDGVWVEVGADPKPYAIRRTYAAVTDVNAAALTQSIALGTPSPGSQLLGFEVFVGTAFAGGSITDVKLALGTAGDPDVILASADVDAATDGRATTRTLGISPAPILGEAVNALFTATGGNLSTATTGSCTVVTTWVQV